MAPPNEGIMLDTDLPQSDTSACFTLSDAKLSISGITLLSDVPSNITLSTFPSICQSSTAPSHLVHQVQSRSHNGCFLGFSQPDSSPRLTNSLGKFNDRHFLSVFRFKVWWTTMWTGTSGSDLQMETQWALLDVPELDSYVLILPLIESNFRSTLHSGTDGHVMITAESGSTAVLASSFAAIAYVHISNNPYRLMYEAYAAARVHLDTFRLLEEKALPPIVDKFGWCTWDACYLTVDPNVVWHGVNDFYQHGGISLRFLIIDDGWQSINFDDGDDPLVGSEDLVLGGEQMTARLYRFEECERFRQYRRGSFLPPGAPRLDPNRPKMLVSKAIEIERAEKDGLSEAKIAELKRELSEMYGGRGGRDDDDDDDHNGCCNDGGGEYGLGAFTKDLRAKFERLDDVYVWHALCGAWGGVRPGTIGLDSKVVPARGSPGLDKTMGDLAVIKIVEGGIGLVHPDQAAELYEKMHSYLAECGITGTKIDVVHTLEYVCEEYGGRVELAKAYYKGLSESIVKNFNGTGVISSMQQCNDFFFLGTQQISMGRVGDDFWFQDPNGDPLGVFWLQGVHMIHCSYNSLWIGQMIQPDWDMFQSDHICAHFHAGSRAICGGPVYLSDCVGSHNFDLIKRLVFPDGTIPKCQHFALPTRDCLFQNPLFDGQTILKIWNFNKFGGVVGAFNCQGAGWDPKLQRIRGYPDSYKPVSGAVHVRDIEWDYMKEASKMGGAEEYVVYLAQSEELLLMTPDSEAIKFNLQPLSFEIFSFVPVRRIGSSIKFAPIGLVNMFNSGGTIVEAEYNEDAHEATARIKVKGGGKLLAYSSGRPKRCSLDGVDAILKWLDDGQLLVDLPWKDEKFGISDVGFAY